MQKKSMKRTVNTIRVVGMMALVIALALACQHDSQDFLQPFKMQQSVQTAQDNSAMIAAAQDVVSTTGSAFANQGLTYGRFADDDEGESDDDCKPTITNTIKINRVTADSTIISGTLTIDFGTGATCDSSEMKKGKIIDSVYIVLSKTMHKSLESITFQNSWKDSTQIDGSFSVSSATGSPTVVKIKGTKIRYHDGTQSSWTGDLTFTYQKSGVGSTYTSSITLTGSWSGTTRKGVNFSANITKDVVFKAGCFGHRHKFIPVSGTIDVTTNGTTSTIDYGDGTCDRLYTITTGGTTTTHHLG
jgi:hypothetical protein